MIFLAAFSYPLMTWLMTGAANTACNLTHSCLSNAHPLLNIVPSALFALFLAYHVGRDVKSKIDWRYAVSRVGRLAKHEEVTEGFADFFDIYIRSKRRSYHLLSAGLLALVFGAVRIYVIVHNGMYTGFFWGVAGTEIFIGLLSLFMSFVVARYYLPGEIVAENTLLLCTLALQKDINIEKAREIVANDIKQFVERKPWWFFN